MCLAIPGRIVEVRGHRARVDYGGGVEREVDVSLVEPIVGAYVLVHAGFAIEVLSEGAAEETLHAWADLLGVARGEERA